MADRYAVCAARFYADLSDRLVEGALRVLGDADVHDVPGAFELPLAAKYCAVIRGETDHYDYVCAETARGIASVALETGVPVAFGVLTVDTMEQALARAGGGKRHQGEDAARAVLRMTELRRALRA